jgi:hypothetical protein
MHTRILLTIMLLGSALPCTSEVIRSVDKDGNVTFSDQPVAGSVESTPVILDVYQPTPREVNESEQLEQQTIQRADQLTNQMDKQNARRAANIQAAQMNLESATAHLREVQVIREGDRQALVGGGTKLRPEYLQRVQDAEQQVMEAQKKLDEAKMAP